MKQAIFTILLFSVIGFVSCKKNQVDIDIKQYDEQQIQDYIKTNGLTGMQRDLTGGDTSGIYYKVILPGSGQFEYTDTLSSVYTIKTFDGLYNSLDTTVNHYQGFVGHIQSSGLPLGLQLIVKNVLKKGGSVRILIPSRLAYGIKGSGSGSSSVTNARIAGNQCLDYYIHSIVDQKAYDDKLLADYLAAKSLTGYQKTTSGIYYKVLTAGSGTMPITNDNVVYLYYTGLLLNGTIFDAYNIAGTGTNFDVPNVIPGLQEMLKKFTTGTTVSTFIPSRLAYARSATGAIPANSNIQFDFSIVSAQ